MRILVITHYSLQENTPRAFRALELIKKMRQDGYEIDVVEGKTRRAITDYQEGMEALLDSQSSVAQKRFKVLRKIGSVVINYLYGDMVIAKYYRKTSKLIRSDRVYDAGISIGQPFYTHMILAFHARKLCRVKIADCGDPFYLNPKRQAPWWGVIQKKVFAKLDYICIPTPIAQKYYERYMQEEKIRIIPQGVNFEAFHRKAYHPNDRVTFAYAGAFYKDIRDPRGFFDFLSGLDDDFCFVLFTDVNHVFYREALKTYVEKLGKKVEVRGLVTREECIQELSGMDFLINLENLSDIQAPSKLIDYGIAQRPVISFTSENFDKDIFMEFMRRNYEHGLQFDISQFDIKNVAKQFESLIEGAV